MLSKEKKQSLERIGRRTDKAHALYFVGRQDIITEIEGTVSDMQELIGERSPAEIAESGINLSDQLTWLVQGAPGAGKTALHSHLQLTWAKQADSPIAFKVNTKDLKNEVSLTELIANHIKKGGAEILNRIRVLELGGGFRWFGLEANVKTTESHQRGPLTLRDLWRLYDKGLPDFIKEQFHEKYNLEQTVAKFRPVVLMIDEVQALEPDEESMLRHLHLGDHGLPIFVVMAGLAWSRTRLRKAGISRFAKGHVRTLEPLADKEVAEAVRRMLVEHGIVGHRDADIAKKIAKWSNGWPQHLHNYMCVLALELAAKDGELDMVDEDKVRDVGNHDRWVYYEERLQDSSIRACFNLLADVAETIGQDGCSEFELLDLLGKRRWDKNTSNLLVMPENMTPQEFIDEMARSGIIHNEHSRITIPIPSFRQHLIDKRLDAFQKR